MVPRTELHDKPKILIMEGYNVALKISDKTLAGRTQDDLSIAPILKESQTKDDKGNKKQTVTGHDVTFSVSGLIDVGLDTNLGRDEVIALALKKGEGAVIDVKYGPDDGSGDIYGGRAIITGYTESTAANGDATYGLNLAISGAFTKVE